MIKRFQTIVFRIELSKAITTSFLLHGAGKMYFYIKFGFFEKATKICAIWLMVLTFTKRQNHKEDCAIFCGLLRKAELYINKFSRLLGCLKQQQIHYTGRNLKQRKILRAAKFKFRHRMHNRKGNNN